MIPPREIIKEDASRLTLDLKLRSGISLHLQWGKEASEKAKKQPALNEDLLRLSQELPKPPPPEATDNAANAEKDDSGKDNKGKQKAKPSGGKKDLDKIKSFLRLGKK